MGHGNGGARCTASSQRPRRAWSSPRSSRCRSPAPLPSARSNTSRRSARSAPWSRGPRCRLVHLFPPGAGTRQGRPVGDRPGDPGGSGQRIPGARQPRGRRHRRRSGRGPLDHAQRRLLPHLPRAARADRPYGAGRGDELFKAGLRKGVAPVRSSSAPAAISGSPTSHRADPPSRPDHHPRRSPSSRPGCGSRSASAASPRAPTAASGSPSLRPAAWERRTGRPIGRVGPDGTLSSFGREPAALGAPIAGPDGNVWFVERHRQGRHGSGHAERRDRAVRQPALAPVPPRRRRRRQRLFTAQRSIGRVTPSGEITTFTDCMDYRQFFSERPRSSPGLGRPLVTSVTSRQLP